MEPPAPRRPHLAPPKFGDAQQPHLPDAQQQRQDAEPGQQQAPVDAGEGSPIASAAEPQASAEAGDRTGGPPVRVLAAAVQPSILRC